MSGGIELQPNNQAQNLPPRAEPPVGEIVRLIEHLTEAAGDENGAIRFNLEWHNRQADDLRQRLTTVFGAAPDEQNQPETLTNRTLNNSPNSASEPDDFKDVQNAPENLRQPNRQTSETRTVENNAGRETQTVAEFDEILAKKPAKSPSSGELVQTLPPDEKTSFKTGDQSKQNFETDVPAADDAANQAAQTKFGEASIDSNRAVLRESKSTLSSSAPAESNREFAARGETMSGAKTGAKIAATTAFASTDLNSISAGNSVLPNAASSSTASVATFSDVPPPALGGAADANSKILENFSQRAQNNSASADAAKSGAAALPLDGGTIAGGALIGGALARLDAWTNTEQIGDARGKSDVFAESGSLAAGATGAMFGAAVGSLSSAAETAISGVLGFVSGAIIGADVNQNLRLLAAGSMNFAAADGATAIEQSRLPGGESLTPGSNLQFVQA